MGKIELVLLMVAGFFGAIPYSEGPWQHKASLSWALVFLAGLLALIGV